MSWIDIDSFLDWRRTKTGDTAIPTTRASNNRHTIPTNTIHCIVHARQRDGVEFRGRQKPVVVAEIGSFNHAFLALRVDRTLMVRLEIRQIHNDLVTQMAEHHNIVIHPPTTHYHFMHFLEWEGATEHK